MDSEELPSNVSGHSWELPTDSPLDAAFQIGDQGCCLQPHAPLSDHQNPALWLKRALPGGSGGGGRGLTSTLCAPWNKQYLKTGRGSCPGLRPRPPVQHRECFQGSALGETVPPGPGEEGEQATGPHRTACQGHCLNTRVASQAPIHPWSGFLLSPPSTERAARLRHEEQRQVHDWAPGT